MATPAATFSTRALNFYKRIVRASLAAYTIPNADTDVMAIPVSGCERVFLKIVTATAALTAFKVKGSPGDGVASVTLASGTTDYTTPTGAVVVACGAVDLTGAAAGTYWLLLNCKGMDTITICVKSGGTATITIEAQAS